MRRSSADGLGSWERESKARRRSADRRKDFRGRERESVCVCV